MILDFPDIPRFYTALAEWLACIFYIYPLSNRIRKEKFLLTLTVALGGQVGLQLLAGYFPLVFWILGMGLNILWMALVIHFIGRATLSITLYTLSKAFVVSELMASFGWQIYCYFVWNQRFDNFMFEIAINFLCFVFCLIIIYVIEQHTNSSDLSKLTTEREILIACFTCLMIFFTSNIGFLLSSTSYSLGNSPAIFFIRTVVNISGICILYLQQFQKQDVQLKKEIAAIESVFNSQYQQYKAFAENSIAVRRTYHDLKHQIDIIRNESDSSKKEEYLEDMVQLINHVGSKIETGNGVLDTILTRKNLYCKQNDINFTCIVDGKILTGMDVMDICSLFGNALDNAIEYVERITNRDQKLVNLRVVNKGNMIMMRLENYCIDEIDLTKGFPNTSKKDKNLHGYGLKSIDYITKKYDGSMSLKFEDNWFILKVLIPISATTVRISQ